MKAVTILAGGYSASRFDLRKLPGTVIAVNDSAYYAPKWDICISMDRLWHENRWAWLEKQVKPIYLRRQCVKNKDVNHLFDGHLFSCDHESTTLSDDPAILNGTHSGFVALNLAYQMRPEWLYIVGMDMALGPRGEKHWYNDYAWSKSTGPGRLAEWRDQFAIAGQQLTKAGISVAITSKEPPPYRDWLTCDRVFLEHRCAA